MQNPDFDLTLKNYDIDLETRYSTSRIGRLNKVKIRASVRVVRSGFRVRVQLGQFD